MDWVFQYKPNTFDLQKQLRNSVDDWWAANQHRSLMLPGQRIFFWRSGDDGAVTAVGHITVSPYAEQSEYGKYKVGIRFESVLMPPLRRSEIATIPELATSLVTSLKGQPGTNFPLARQDAERFATLISDRLRTASDSTVLGEMARRDAELLRRKDTALDQTQEAIKTAGGSSIIVAVQVQFAAEFGGEPSYADSMLDNGDVILIGRGKRSNGDQKLTHGNAALATAIDNVVHDPFPVYEKIGSNRYRLLGDFVASSMSYSELDALIPGYKVYRFVLKPNNNGAVTDGERVILSDFDQDIAQDISPDRRQRVVAIIARNRSRAEAVKRAAGYKCERCGMQTSWKTVKKDSYVEIHHIVPLGEDGSDSKQNMIAVCADCHRFLHLGTDRGKHIAALARQRGLEYGGAS